MFTKDDIVHLGIYQLCVIRLQWFTEGRKSICYIFPYFSSLFFFDMHSRAIYDQYFIMTCQVFHKTNTVRCIRAFCCVLLLVSFCSSQDYSKQLNMTHIYRYCLIFFRHLYIQYHFLKVYIKRDSAVHMSKYRSLVSGHELRKLDLLFAHHSARGPDAKIPFNVKVVTDNK